MSIGTIPRFLIVLSLFPLLNSGCAYSYFDDDGSRRVIGFVDIRIREDSGSTFAGHIVDFRSLGGTVSRNAQGASFSLGYAREVSAAIQDHSLVLGDSLDPIEVMVSAGNGARGQDSASD